MFGLVLLVLLFGALTFLAFVCVSFECVRKGALSDVKYCA